MPVLLPNLVFDTQRSARNPATGVTTPPTTYLVQVEGHVEVNRLDKLQAVPEAALQAPYVVWVASGTDIVEGDRLANLVRKSDRTVWPGDMKESGVVFWSVVHAAESPPGLLALRALYVRREIGGGPAHP